MFPLVSVPKTTVDFPGCPIPSWAHLGASVKGSHVHNLIKGIKEWTVCSTASKLNEWTEADESCVGDSGVVTGSKNITIGDISRDEKNLTTSELSPTFELATLAVAELKIK